MADKERNRLNTEQLLYQALENSIIEEGFENVGVNALAARARVSKVLIYRYFGSLENMILEYLSKQDFWINFTLDLPAKDKVLEYIKELFNKQINDLKANKIAVRLLRWELNESNATLEKLRLKRESKSMALITIISQFSGYAQESVSSLFILINATINYLIILKDTCPIYNGIDLQSENGWKLINQTIDDLIDRWFIEK